MEAIEKLTELKAELLERLHNPIQLRLFTMGIVLLVGCVGIYMPLSSSISDTSRQLGREQIRLELARDIEHLRAQFNAFKDRLPAKKDPNEWVEYVLDGIRTLPVKLVTLDLAPQRDVGPYKAVVMRISLEGEFHDMESFLVWLESNERLFRVDEVKIVPSRKNKDVLAMDITVLGVMG